MNKKIVFKVPIEGFQYLQGDAFAYQTIISGQTVIIPQYTEHIITDIMEILGDVEVEGIMTVL